MNGLEPKVTLNNVKIISEGKIIFYNRVAPDSISVKNYELFGNKDIKDNVVLKIGDFDNFAFVYSEDLT